MIFVIHEYQEPLLVGGLVAIFYFPIYWVAFIIPIDEVNHFSEGFFPNHQAEDV